MGVQTQCYPQCSLASEIPAILSGLGPCFFSHCVLCFLCPQGLPLRGHSAFRINSLCHISLTRPVCPETASDWRLKLSFMVDGAQVGVRGTEMGEAERSRVMPPSLNLVWWNPACQCRVGSTVATCPHVYKKEISVISHLPLKFLPPVSFLSTLLARIKPCDCQSPSGNLRN